MSDVCGHRLTDHTGTTVTCERRPQHRDDHKAGYLRWGNDGAWYAVHYLPQYYGQRSTPCPYCQDNVFDLEEHWGGSCTERQHGKGTDSE